MSLTKDGETSTPQGTDGIIQTIYSSTASIPFSEKQLHDLLAKARKHNHSLNISGLLIYHEGFFIQVLEGPEREVNSLYSSISRDKRHNTLRLLLSHNIKEKEYENWAMGFVDISRLPKQKGFISYGELQSSIRDTNSAKKIIQMFQNGQWRQSVNL